MDVGKELLIQDSGDLSNFALFLPGILTNSELQTFCRLIHLAIMQVALVVFTSQSISKLIVLATLGG